MTQERPVSHNLLARGDAEVEDRNSQLKLFIELTQKQSERALCLGEILHVRAQQLQARVKAGRI